MKIKLDASNEKHRAVASCFVGCEVEYPYNSVAHLTGIYKGKYLLSEYKDFEDDVDTYWLRTTITLDLTRCQPCIYACMKAGLKVKVERFEHERIRMYDFSKGDEQLLFMDDHVGFSSAIKSIRILGLEKMEGVEVEE